MRQTETSSQANSGVKRGTLAERALQAAREIFEENGDESQITLRGIARRVGVAAPSLYVHFDGIEEIKFRLVQAAFDAFADTVGPVLSSSKPAPAKVFAFLSAYLAFARGHPQLYRLIFSRTAPSTMPEIGRKAAAMFSQLTTLLESLSPVQDSVSTPHERTVSIWLEIHGIATLPPAHPNFQWPSDEKLLANLYARATSVREPGAPDVKQ